MNVFPKSETMTAAAGRNVVAVLGPTNTGKTHLAIERMLAHPTGIIGLPLRLLAREVYGRIAERAGADAVALITGEEKIIPPEPRYRVCTVEALPNAAPDVSFVAIDEIQIAADLERGHVFTDRLLNLRGRDETLLLGASTMRGVVEKLIPGVNVVTRPRMSVLSYAGSKKITRLPRRSAVVAFSADEVYAIAELIRRQRGGAAVVLGALSPRTRNAQVELFQNGDVDFLVATDAIGMGLNLDVDHVAFAGDRKFDGYQYRRLTAAEFAQVAGRAGRYLRDGTFGVTGRVGPLEDALVEALESHRFDSVKVVQWRNRDLDFASLDALRASLDVLPTRAGLTRAPLAEDQIVLERAICEPEIRELADRPKRIGLLWDVCQVPDYRRIAPANHADLVLTLYTHLARRGVIDEDWFAGQVAFADRTDGDIDTLANRIAHIRTWTFAANQRDWLADRAHWQERTRSIEDRLSDALHERLTQRFVDRRTSVLMRRLRENAMLEAEITPAGDVTVEGQHVGQLQGFRFVPDQSANGEDAKAIRAAAQKALAGEIARRAEGVAAAGNDHFILASDGTIRWQGITVARLIEGDDVLRPRIVILADELLSGGPRDLVQARLEQWLSNHIETLLKPLFDLKAAEELAPLARGVAFRLFEGLGVVERPEVAEDVRGLDQDMRAGLRKLGVRFGAHHVYVPPLLKPAPSGLLAILWGIKHGGLDTPGIAELPQMAAAGRTTFPVDPAIPPPLYKVVGYRIAGPRAVRIDILERLADLIRPLLAWRPTAESPEPPVGAVTGGGFTVTVGMTSLLGASGEDFSAILKSLGYRLERRRVAPKAEAGALSREESLAIGVTPPDEAADLQPAPGQVVHADAGPLAMQAAMTAGGGSGSSDSGGEAAGNGDEDGEEAAPDVPVLDRGEGAPDTVDQPADVEGAEDTATVDTPAAPSEGDAGELDSPGETPSSLEPGDGEGLDDPGVSAEATARLGAAVPSGTGEPEFIEIWRPGRADRRPGNRPGQRPRDQRRPERTGVAATAGEPAGDTPAGDGRGAERRGSGGPGGRSDGGRPDGGRRSEEGRHREGGQRPDRGDKPRFGKGAHGEHGRDRDRRSEQRESRSENRGQAPRPPQRERQADPNSPFAALAALKAALEGRKSE